MSLPSFALDSTPSPSPSVPLWSKGYASLCNANCSVPRSYSHYSHATHVHTKASNLVKYFSACPHSPSDRIWIRLTGCRADGNDASDFISHVLPTLTDPFHLVTTDGDCSAPSAIAHEKVIHELLESPLLLSWKTQNYDGSIVHRKVREREMQRAERDRDKERELAVLIHTL